MLYSLNYPTFEQYLSIPYINLAIPGPAGISIKELIRFKDIECEKLLERSEPDYNDNLGLGILRYQIIKTLYPSLKNSHIFCRSNIFELLALLKTLINKLKLIEFTGDYLSINNQIHEAIKTDTYIAIYHETQIELEKINLNDKVIILSNISSLYGITSHNIAWAVVSDHSLFQVISKEIHQQQASCSFYSEIISIIALRNQNHINALNEEIKLRNLDSLNAFFFRHKELFNWNPPQIGYQGLLGFNDTNFIAEQYCTELLHKAKILLTLTNDKSKIIINCGQKAITPTLLQWAKYL